jgi:EpsI family protein
MLEHSIRVRILMTAGLLVGATALLHHLSHGERVPPHRPLRAFPLVLENWKGADSPILERIITAVGVDDYLNRVYANGGTPPVMLYVGYYESQQTGDLAHSPKNCLPGSGWEPVRASRLTIEVPGLRPIQVNQYLVKKGLDELLVLYWYQGRGRVIASEYWGKVWLVADAITRNRTDVALIRISTPTVDGEVRARNRAAEFAQAVYPRLSQFLPD